ncbi:hypothetical protein HMPREF1981_02542 [Bacteroides pyogenes F0041]|uniref:Uncharacterized protein n=1 Tax=Bacteroides pyogenes F0041 TaxID=1321819 RepID=U2C0E6_9BACE|nr:hypothetical protein HMPREF1981_02542 [Bacteroides pyogenes F0041]
MFLLVYLFPFLYLLDGTNTSNGCNCYAFLCMFFVSRSKTISVPSY